MSNTHAFVDHFRARIQTRLAATVVGYQNTFVVRDGNRENRPAPCGSLKIRSTMVVFLLRPRVPSRCSRAGGRKRNERMTRRYYRYYYYTRSRANENKTAAAFSRNIVSRHGTRFSLDDDVTVAAAGGDDAFRHGFPAANRTEWLPLRRSSFPATNRF